MVDEMIILELMEVLNALLVDPGLKGETRSNLSKCHERLSVLKLGLERKRQESEELR